MKLEKAKVILMMTQPNLNSILKKLLRKDKSSNTRELVSFFDKDIDVGEVLRQHGIEVRFENNNQEIRVFLDSSPHLIIFKNLQDAINLTKEQDLKKKFILLDTSVNPKNIENIRNNIEAIFSFKKILKDFKIIDFDETIPKIHTLLSPDYGNISISYNTNTKERLFYQENNNFSFSKLKEKLSNDEYADFFKKAIAKFLHDKPKPDIYLILSNLNFLTEQADKNLSLYRRNFSFEKFKQEFDKDLTDEMKRFQDLISNFHTKVMAIPIQVGVYIVLVEKATNIKLSIFVSILIFVWSFFNHQITAKTFSNIIQIENGINYKIQKLLEETGLSKNDTKDKQNQINTEITNTKNLICWYQGFYILITVLMIIYAWIK